MTLQSSCGRWAFRLAVGAIALAGCHDQPMAQGQEIYTLEGVSFRVEVAAENLEVPWDMAWLPDGRMIVAERPGRLRLVEQGSTQPVLLAQLEAVEQAGEGGLMGLALSPQFAQDRRIYLSFTTLKARKRINRISSFHLPQVPPAHQLSERPLSLSDERVLVDDLPGSSYHDGLPLSFGPDGKLYASTGDAGRGQLAQQTDSLAGKFLRLNPDGSLPADNPIPGSPIWTLGHRNCQGFSWNPVNNQLYATEHGPSVPVDSLVGGGDEINLITKGLNYGWPMYHHDKNAEGFVAPLWTWTPAIAPAGAAFYRGPVAAWQNGFFFATLRGEALWFAKFDPQNPSQIRRLEQLLHRKFGRLRAVRQEPDGLLYFSTSNRDKRGTPASNDDRVLRIVPVGTLSR